VMHGRAGRAATGIPVIAVALGAGRGARRWGRCRTQSVSRWGADVWMLRATAVLDTIKQTILAGRSPW